MFGDLSYRFTGLLDGQTYTASVVARNAACSGVRQTIQVIPCVNPGIPVGLQE